MTREEAIKLLEHISIAYTPTDAYGDYDDPQPYEEAIDMAIESLSNYTTKKPNDVVEQKNDVVAEPTDLISRADALEELGEYFDHLKRIDKRGIKRIEPISLDCKGIINKLPSADRPSGEWISNNDGSWNCSECGLRVFIYAKGNYCPNCGADMRGEPHDD